MSRRKAYCWKAGAPRRKARVLAGIASLAAGVLILQPAAGAETNGADGLPVSPLRPPRAEIPPSFWEQNGTYVVVGTLALLALVGVIVWFLLKPKPKVITPPVVLARRDLETLRTCPEDGGLLSRVSGIVRHYIAAEFDFGPDELNTSEFCQRAQENAKLGPELNQELSRFLRQCDLVKFAPAKRASPVGAVSQAMRLIDLAQGRLEQFKATAAQEASGESGAKVADGLGATK